MLPFLLRRLYPRGFPWLFPEPYTGAGSSPSSTVKAAQAFEQIVGRPPKPDEDAIGFVLGVAGPLAEALRTLRISLTGIDPASEQRLFEVSCAAGR